MFRRAEPQVDPVLGALEHRRGHWRGAIVLGPFDAVAVAVPGSKKMPDEAALALARTAPDEYQRTRAGTVAELVDHGRTLDADVGHAGDIAPAYVAVVELDRRLVLEFGYVVPWDDDHTLGARVSDGTLIELNGSVIAP
jgi:hypothetical protein